MATTAISKLIKIATLDSSDVFLVSDTDAGPASKKITSANFETDMTANPLDVDGGGTGANLSATGGATEYAKQASAGAAFTVGTIAAVDLPSSTETAKGAIEIATQAEVSAGIDATRLVTPARLQGKLDIVVNIGQIQFWAGATAPDKWLLCDGSNVNRITYADLFGVIGTTFGVGDGSTTFGMPDMRGSTAIGVSGTYVLAATGGADTHTLVTAELPSHTHSDARDGIDTADIIGSGSGSAGIASSPSASTGGGEAHNNLPTFLTMNDIIFAGI